MDENPHTSAVRAALARFQAGYTARDLGQLETFMNLFVPDGLEVIGTNGVAPGEGEWYLDRAGARELVEGDWQGWGDLRLDVEGAHIHTLGDVAWLATSATVTTTIGAESNYRSYLERIGYILDHDQRAPDIKLLYILRGLANTLYELRRGEEFVWPLRFTAVLVQSAGQWLFHQVNFSMPTLYLPDARLLPGPGEPT